MDDIATALEALGRKIGIRIEPDENGTCALELADGRTLVVQRRAGADELDFVATLGEVPEAARAAVFERLLAANFYWKGTLGATLSWNAALEEVVLIFPLPLADATPESVETVFARFVDLQSAWAARFAALVAAARDIGPDADDDDSGEDAESGEAGTGGDAAKDNLIISP